jgi:hypothetical protein
MVDFGIKRLRAEQKDASRVYHLFDRDDTLKLVADYGSPWLPSGNADRTVRFARTSGKTIAHMDLAATATKVSGSRHSRDYAVVLNHAVYAILSEYQLQDDDDVERTYFVMHVADSMWLALKEEGNQPYFTLYSEVPASLTSRSMRPMFSDLPEPIGEIDRELHQYDYAVTWQADGIEHAELLVMALVFLIDRLGDVHQLRKA